MAETAYEPNPKGIFTFPDFEDTVAGTNAGSGIGLPAGTKVYRALLTQIADNAPTATVLENTLPGTPVWSYIVIGVYDVTLAAAFPQDLTFFGMLPANETMITSFSYTAVTWRNINSIRIITGNGDNFFDSLLSKTPFEIIVYPS